MTGTCPLSFGCGIMKQENERKDGVHTMNSKLRAKRISKQHLAIYRLWACGLAVIVFMATSGQMAMMTGGWSNFRQSMSDFFYTGLGGDGAAGIGIVIAVVGVILAAVSFVMHKMNPQSRMPGWFTCLVIAVIGSLLFTGVQPVLDVIMWLRDTVMGWFGFSGFGTF